MRVIPVIPNYTQRKPKKPTDKPTFQEWLLLALANRKEKKMKEKYVVGQDFNTKDWFVYDNETDDYIYYCDTEEEAIGFVAGRSSNE